MILKNAWVHSVLILFVIGLILFPSQTVLFSQSILGKLAAILLILFYAIVDHFYGLFVCLLLVLFYQEIVHQNRPHSKGKEGFEKYEPNTVNVAATPLLTEDSGFTPSYEISPPEPEEAEFQKEFCHMGKLKYKGYEISKENAEHVFPQLQFRDEEPCDPCEGACKYSISEVSHLERAVAPKSSKDWMAEVQDGWEQGTESVSQFVYQDLFAPVNRLFQGFVN